MSVCECVHMLVDNLSCFPSPYTIHLSVRQNLSRHGDHYLSWGGWQGVLASSCLNCRPRRCGRRFERKAFANQQVKGLTPNALLFKALLTRITKGKRGGPKNYAQISLVKLISKANPPTITLAQVSVFYIIMTFHLVFFLLFFLSLLHISNFPLLKWHFCHIKLLLGWVWCCMHSIPAPGKQKESIFGRFLWIPGHPSLHSEYQNIWAYVEWSCLNKMKQTDTKLSQGLRSVGRDARPDQLGAAPSADKVEGKNISPQVALWFPCVLWCAYTCRHTNTHKINQCKRK